MVKSSKGEVKILFATFVCKNCNHKIIIDFTKLNNIPNSCPKCGTQFSNSHYITSFAEKFLNLQRALLDLEFLGLSSGEPNIVFKSDLKMLNELYAHSSEEVRKLLTDILDKNYLMVYHAAKDEDLKTLKEYHSKLKNLHIEKVNFENEELKKLLDGGNH